MRLAKRSKFRSGIKTHGRRMEHSCTGFTLMELMVAVAVMAILATIAYPAYTGAIRKAKRAEGRSALMQLMQEEERYFSQNNRYALIASDSTDKSARKFKWHSADSPGKSAYEIVASACAGDVIENCVQLNAKPGTDKVDASYKDPECGELGLASNGKKTASGKGASCW
ncbi:MAG: type pilin protein [Noviherbaspirillum sp.]|jgi:type IV pilus assembly protein PilE|nr:type pilin protein [Noviherbaspirillum sp.]